MIFKKQKGFTLIELLVVISIIGVLSTIVISSLGEARNKAKDAAGKAAISQARTTLELWYLDNGTYQDGVNQEACTNVVAKFTTSLTKNGATFIKCISYETDEYYYGATFPGGDVFCSDSTGFSGIVDSPGQYQDPISCEDYSDGSGQQQ